MRSHLVRSLVILISAMWFAGCVKQTTIDPASTDLEHRASTSQPTSIEVEVTGAQVTSASATQPAATQPATVSVEGVTVTAPAGTTAKIKMTKGGGEEEIQKGSAKGARLATSGDGEVATNFKADAPKLELSHRGSKGSGGGFSVESLLSEGVASSPLTWIGGVLIIAGVVGFALRFTTLPFARLIPWQGCGLLIVGGALTAFLPYLYVALGPPMSIAIVCVFLVVAAGVALYFGMRVNWFNEETGTEKQLELASKGHADAAGAFARLHAPGNEQEKKARAKQMASLKPVAPTTPAPAAPDFRGPSEGPPGGAT